MWCITLCLLGIWIVSFIVTHSCGKIKAPGPALHWTKCFFQSKHLDYLLCCSLFRIFMCLGIVKRTLCASGGFGRLRPRTPLQLGQRRGWGKGSLEGWADSRPGACQLQARLSHRWRQRARQRRPEARQIFAWLSVACVTYGIVVVLPTQKRVKEMTLSLSLSLPLNISPSPSLSLSLSSPRHGRSSSLTSL